MHTVRIATNPRKWRRPAPCPACRQSRPLILTLGAIYKLRTRKPVNTIYGCICPNCRHKCILHIDGRSLNKAIRLWNHHPRALRRARRMRQLGQSIHAGAFGQTHRLAMHRCWRHVSGADKEPAR